MTMIKLAVPMALLTLSNGASAHNTSGSSLTHTAANEDPAVTVDQIYAKNKELNDAISPIMHKPKPKPKVEEKKQEEPAAAEEQKKEEEPKKEEEEKEKPEPMDTSEPMES